MRGEASTSAAELIDTAVGRGFTPAGATPHRLHRRGRCPHRPGRGRGAISRFRTPGDGRPYKMKAGFPTAGTAVPGRPRADDIRPYSAYFVPRTASGTGRTANGRPYNIPVRFPCCRDAQCASAGERSSFVPYGDNPVVATQRHPYEYTRGGKFPAPTTGEKLLCRGTKLYIKQKEEAVLRQPLPQLCN